MLVRDPVGRFQCRGELAQSGDSIRDPSAAGLDAKGFITLGRASGYGYGDPYAPRNGEWQHVDVVVSTNRELTTASYNMCNRSIPRWSLSTGAIDGCQVSMVSVVAHEMGHGLGLAHPVGNGAPLMSCLTPSGQAKRPVADDGNGVRWYYGNKKTQWGRPIATNCN